MKKLLVTVLLVPIVIVACVFLQQPDPAGLALVAGLVIGLVLVALPRFGRSPREKLGGGLEGAPTDPAERRAYLRAFLLTLGLVGYVHGLWRLVEPNAARATGRWAWLHNLFLDTFGLVGPAILSFVAGTILLLLAFRSKGRPKR